MEDGVTARRGNPPEGFSLVELILVMAIISLTFLFFIPRFPSFSGDDRKMTLQLTALAKKLKQRAGEGVPGSLDIDPNAGKIWAVSGMATEQEGQPPMNIALALPENLRILDVVFRKPGGERDEVPLRIHFYKKGYSDWAVIHFEKDDKERFSMVIEPFLSEVSLVEGYYEFEGQ